MKYAWSRACVHEARYEQSIIGDTIWDFKRLDPFQSKFRLQAFSIK